jgi:hypothetical protein
MAAWKVFWVDEDFWKAQADWDQPQRAADRLGSAIQRLLDETSPSTSAGVGGLGISTGHEDHPFVAYDLAGSLPQVLLWSRGDLTLESASEVSVADLADASLGNGLRPALLCSTDSDRVGKADALALGTAVYRLIREPVLDEVSAGDLPVRRGPRVGLDEERWVVWLRGVLRDPATLTPPEIIDFRWQPPALSPAMDGELSLAGFVLGSYNPLGSYRFEETFVPSGPGQLSVFFGRNGAGKSLALGAVEATLGDLRGAVSLDPDEAGVRPRCAVLLDAAQQESASRLFAQVLAHLGWGPDSDMPFAVKSACGQAIPAWSSAQARPPGAPGRTVAELADMPLEQLRAAVAAGVAAWLPGDPSGSTRILADALASSAVLAVTADWRVGLAVIPGQADSSLAAAASQYLVDARAADQEVFAESLQGTFYRWARHLVGEERSGPIVMVTAKLAHAAPWFGPNDPESGWQQLGEQLAVGVKRNIPRPVVFAPGRNPLQEGDAAAEDAVLGLVEHLMEPSKDAEQRERRHPFAIYLGHAARLADLLQQHANQLLPRFVADAGSLKLGIAHPGEWHTRRATAMFTGGLTGDVAVDDLPSGLRTWALAAISFAQAQLQGAAWTGVDEVRDTFRCEPDGLDAIYDSGSGWTAKHNAFRRSDPASLTPQLPAAPNVLYLLDEPEAHLHLTAQRDVVEAVASLAAASRGVLVATHSLGFLDTPPGRTQILTLHASAAKIRSSSWTGLRDLTVHAGTLGITPSALAQACRGVLVVEGRTDREIIDLYSGIDLDKERIVVVVLQGVDHALGIAELEFLHTLRIPIYVLFDHVRREAIENALDGKIGARRFTKEEIGLTTLHNALRDRRLSVICLPFQHIDIVRAIPEAEITWALQQLGRAGFTGWKDLDTRADAAFRKNKQKFKDTFWHVTGASVDEVVKCLRKADRRDRSPVLHGTLASMLNPGPGPDPRPGITLAP